MTFHLNEKATVTFTVQRAEAGREVNGRCQPHSDTHHNANACVMWRTVSGSLRVTARRGNNRLAFTGHIGRNKPKAGFTASFASHGIVHIFKCLRRLP